MNFNFRSSTIIDDISDSIDCEIEQHEFDENERLKRKCISTMQNIILYNVT